MSPTDKIDVALTTLREGVEQTVETARDTLGELGSLLDSHNDPFSAFLASFLVPDYPEPVVANCKGDDALHRELIGLIEAAGYTYSEPTRGDLADMKETGNPTGYTSHEDRTVMVAADIGAGQKLQVTTHELAHIVLHDPLGISPLGLLDLYERKANDLTEVEAESVAFVVLHALGHNVGDHSFGYIAGWSHSEPGKVDFVADRVREAARVIIANMPIARAA